MTIIEAFQQAENGKLITCGIYKRFGRFLKYMGNGVFFEYEMENGVWINGTPKYLYDVRNFPFGYIMSIDWEAFDDVYFKNS